MPFQRGNDFGGSRPKKSALWKEVENEIREALPRLLRMDRVLLAKFIKDGNPTGVEMTAYAFITKYPESVMERFLPKAWADDPVEAEKFVSNELLQLDALEKPNELTNGHAHA